VQYAVAAISAAAAKNELERRLLDEKVSADEIEHVVAATGAEAARLNLPAGGIMLLHKMQLFRVECGVVRLTFATNRWSPSSLPLALLRPSASPSDGITGTDTLRLK
jgi:hypothetical protein